MAAVSHPNVVQVLDVGLHEGQLFIAMELVEGTTLARWIRDRDPEEVLAAYRHAGEGLL